MLNDKKLMSATIQAIKTDQEKDDSISSCIKEAFNKNREIFPVLVKAMGEENSWKYSNAQLEFIQNYFAKNDLDTLAFLLV